MRNGADFTKADLDKVDNAQLVTMSRDEATDWLDGNDEDDDIEEAIMSAIDHAQTRVEHGGVTFVVIRVEG